MDPAQKETTTMTRTEIYMESNRRGFAAAQAAIAAGDYGTAMTDRAMDTTAQWLESQGLPAGSEEHQHAEWCFAQGVAGHVLGERACADVRFGVGDQPPTTLTVTVSLDNGNSETTIADNAAAATFIARYGERAIVEHIAAEGLPSEDYDDALAVLRAFAGSLSEGEIPTLP